MVLETTTLPIELYPCNMGRAMGIEPMRAGATIQCVNHFTTPAINGTSAYCGRPFKPAAPEPPGPSPAKYFRRMGA